MLSHINLKPHSVVIFNLDGTLITLPANDQYRKWQPLIDRKKVLCELIRTGHTIAIVSNQDCVAFGHATEDDVKQKIAEVIKYFDLPHETPWRACYHHPKATNSYYQDQFLAARRKPSPAMLQEVQASQPHRQHYFVGDSPEDQVASLSAQIPFIWERDFFSPL